VTQNNHLLRSTPTHLSHLADDPQTLINGVNEAGGLSFIAHPKDPEAPAFNETDISWEAWDVRNYTGIELWNGLSELKTVVATKLHGASMRLPGSSVTTRSPKRFNAG
jgi:hypothetical protein